MEKSSIILYIVLIVICFANSQCMAASGSPRGSGPQQAYAENEVLVKFRKDISGEQIARINKELRTEVIKEMGSLLLIQIPKGVSVEEMVRRFNRLPEVEYAEPNYIYSIQK